MSAWLSQANSQKQSDSGLDGPVGSSLESFFPDFGIEQSVFVQEMGWVLALRELGSWAMASIRFPNCQEVFCPGMYGSCSKGLNPESPGGAISLQAQWQ